MGKTLLVAQDLSICRIYSRKRSRGRSIRQARVRRNLFALSRFREQRACARARALCDTCSDPATSMSSRAMTRPVTNTISVQYHHRLSGTDRRAVDFHPSSRLMMRMMRSRASSQPFARRSLGVDREQMCMYVCMYVCVCVCVCVCVAHNDIEGG